MSEYQLDQSKPNIYVKSCVCVCRRARVFVSFTIACLLCGPVKNHNAGTNILLDAIRDGKVRRGKIGTPRDTRGAVLFRGNCEVAIGRAGGAPLYITTARLSDVWQLLVAARLSCESGLRSSTVRDAVELECEAVEQTATVSWCYVTGNSVRADRTYVQSVLVAEQAALKSWNSNIWVVSARMVAGSAEATAAKAPAVTTANFILVDGVLSKGELERDVPERM